MSQFERVDYKDLKPKQQEVYNFQKLASELADYGFNCIKLSDDWNGADFLAYKSDVGLTLRVQQKSCPTIQQNYIGKDLWMAFPIKKYWYLIKHDEFRNLLDEHTVFLNSPSWKKGKYTIPRASAELIELLTPYRLH